MAENSHIEWTTHTFNPWMGCTKVSDGCKHCYAETLMDKRHNKVQWGPKGARIRTSESYWRNPIKWNREAEAKGERARVFCASLADVFEGPETMPNDSWPVVEQAREDLFQLIDATPSLDWQILTKRPENIESTMIRFGIRWELPNIWLGTSIEDHRVLGRIRDLTLAPAVVHFLSIEPLIGDVGILDLHDIEWVIVGGESGPGKRPFNCDWARSIRDQCNAANVPFFMKQVDKVQPIPDDLMIREFPKKVTP